MGEDTYLTIGKVVKKLQSQYPDLSVSKVRYLEEEGLVTPRRTSGGYRVYSQRDLRRLERILHLQKTRFLPLAVIRNILEQEDLAGSASADGSSTGDRATQLSQASVPQVSVQLQDEDVVEPLLIDEELINKLHPIDHIPDLLGVSITFVRHLSNAGIITLSRSPHGRDLVDGKDFVIIRTCDELNHIGIAPKNLRQYVNAANRESGLFEQALVAYAGRGELDDEHRKQVVDVFAKMLALTNSLRSQLIRRTVGKRFRDIGDTN